MRKPTTIHAHQVICNPLSALRMIARSSKAFAILFAFAICLTGLGSAEEVEITGTLELEVTCNKDFHVETVYLVEPGKDKFSGVYHALDLPKEARAMVSLGSKLKVKGIKQEAVVQKMNKGQIRKVMFNQIKHGKGVPVEVQGGLDEIIKKIQVQAEAKEENKGPLNQHKHGELQLKPVADDEEVVEVRIPAHIQVTEVTEIK